jgi:hypothetical protein
VVPVLYANGLVLGIIFIDKYTGTKKKGDRRHPFVFSHQEKYGFFAGYHYHPYGLNDHHFYYLKND